MRPYVCNLTGLLTTEPTAVFQASRSAGYARHLLQPPGTHAQGDQSLSSWMRQVWGQRHPVVGCCCAVAAMRASPSFVHQSSMTALACRSTRFALGEKPPDNMKRALWANCSPCWMARQH